MAPISSTRRAVEAGPRPDQAPPAVEPPAITMWADALRRACAAAASTALAYEEGPEPLDHGHGTWAFGFRLRPTHAPTDPRTDSTTVPPADPAIDSTTVPPSDSQTDYGAAAAEAAGWTEPLTVRVALDRRDLDREAAAMRLNAWHGLRAPVARAVVELDLGAAAPPLWALISEPRAEVALPELIGFNLHQANDLLAGFARHHAAIHDLPVDGAEARAALPAVDVAAELSRIDAERFRAEHRWLAARVPEPGQVVLCHGGYQPLCVSGPPPAAWPEHGGPGHGLTADNWCGAVLAEPEFDVAFTLVAFWSAHCFAPNRSERTAIKMIRNTLLNTYKLGYQSCRRIDPDRVRFWQAFHALRGLARMSGGYDEVGSPFAAQDRGPLPDALATELQRHFKQLTRVR